MWSTKRLTAVWACRPGVGSALSKTWGAAGSWTNSWQRLQAHLPRIWRCTKNCAGMMSSRSLVSSPTRTIGSAALGRWAVGVFGLDALVHARQMGRQCFALGLAAGLLLGCTGAGGAALGGGMQGCELGLQAGLVSGQRLLEDVALLGVHGLGLGTELPGLQPRQLEGDALDLCVTPLDGLRLRFDPLVLFANVFALLANVGQHFRCNDGQFASAERLDILSCDRMYIEHAAIVQN